MAGSAHAQDLSKYPDWSGQWRNTSAFSGIRPSRSARRAGPAHPEYQARYEANLADQAAGGLGDDPTVNASRTACAGDDRRLPDGNHHQPKTTYILPTTPYRGAIHRRTGLPKELGHRRSTPFNRKWGRHGQRRRYSTLEAETRGFKVRAPTRPAASPPDDNQTVIKERISLDRPTELRCRRDHDHRPCMTRPLGLSQEISSRSEPTPIWHFNDAPRTTTTLCSERQLFITSTAS